jgi:mediator of RNA polymerase II transcription subunit 13
MLYAFLVIWSALLIMSQGDYEAITYQAFSIKRNTNPTTTQHRDWSPSDDVRAAEAELRHGQHLVTQDASRPWLWHFKPTSLDMVGQDNIELPPLEGYRLQRRQSISILYSYTDLV